MNFIKEIKLSTSHPIQVIDITADVRQILKESGVADGTVNIITQHTTTAININEKEDGLQSDMVRFLTELVPKGAGYDHDRKSPDGRVNAHSHLMTLLTNASETIPVANGEMMLGNWQSIFFIELDGPRNERTVIVQVV